MCLFVYMLSSLGDKMVTLSRVCLAQCALGEAQVHRDPELDKLFRKWMKGCKMHLPFINQYKNIYLKIHLEVLDEGENYLRVIFTSPGFFCNNYKPSMCLQKKGCIQNDTGQ